MIPELIDIGAERMVLPLGRYSCTLEEVQERYVPKDDANRNAIWEGFLKTIDLIKGAVGSLAEVWIGGVLSRARNILMISMLFSFSRKGIFKRLAMQVPLSLMCSQESLNQLSGSTSTLTILLSFSRRRSRIRILRGGFLCVGIGTSSGLRRDLATMMHDGSIRRQDIWR